MLRPGDRAEQQRTRLQAAQMVPVALLDGVDREQVQGAGGHQPQRLRAFEVQAGVAGAVEGGAHRAQHTEDEVALVTALTALPLVHASHLIAP